MTYTDISIIICTHNRSHDVSECLAALVPQLEHAPVDVVVVDSGSNEVEQRIFAQLIAKKPLIRLVRVDQPGLSIARNVGIAETTAPWIAFLDDDAVPASDWVANAHRLVSLVPNNCAIIAGAAIPLLPRDAVCPTGKRRLQMLSVVEQPSEGDQTHTAAMVAANVIFKRSALAEVGGFSAKLGRYGATLLSGDEKLIQERLIASGWRVWISNRLSAQHKISAERLTKQWILRRAYWDGVSDQRIRKLNSNKPSIVEVVKVVAKVPVLLLLYYLGKPEGEFPIRYWYDIGWLSEWLHRSEISHPR
jgi:glucosyl-dolichyl phosphate glucuronosyltransferase